MADADGGDDTRSLLAAALSSTPSLSQHLDEDTSEYVLSILLEDPRDPDAREAVAAFLQSSIEDFDDDAAGAEDVCGRFFEILDASLKRGGIGDGVAHLSLGGGGGAAASEREDEAPLRKLDSAITLKSRDIQTFASGLVAEADSSVQADPEAPSTIQRFYANMIDASNHPRARSERERRKARQREMRERMEEEERRRAIDDSARMLAEDEGAGGAGGGGDAEEDAADVATASDNAADVHLNGFHLPNRKGGGPDLLSDANLTLASGRRYGLMGRNGCGKTTLLTALAARQLNDGASGGGGGVPRNMSMLLVRQEIMGNELSAVETVLKSDVKREGVKRWIEHVEKELEKLDNPQAAADESKAGDEKQPSKRKQKLKDRKKNKAPSAAARKSSSNKKSQSTQEESTKEKRKRLNAKLASAYERLARVEQEEGGDPEPNARRVLFGLGFTTAEMQDKPTRELSGGWRMRVSLSCALFANPALLLLDEPTNHLDLEAVLWLERYLTKDFRGTLVVVSHDRHFLNEVVTDVVHFHRGKLATYRGDISNFVAVREENRKRQIRLYEQQEAKRAHLQKYIDLHAQAGENGVKAARQRKSRMKKLDKLGVMAAGGDGKKFKASYDGEAEEVEEYEEDEEVVLTFPDPGGFDANIVGLNQVTFGYTPDKILLEEVDLTIDMKSRIALLGRNGCGKSTLIKIIVGALSANKGKVSIDGRAKIEYLAQHQLEQLDPDSCPMETMLERYPGDMGNTHKGAIRRYLANFGLGGNELPTQKIHTMSGGQKCRLCLAAAMYRKPHLLILDEPTNHLDMETTNALINAITEFQGGVLLVSHDEHLLTSVCKHLYVVEKGHVGLLRQGMTNVEAFERYKKDVIEGRR